MFLLLFKKQKQKKQFLNLEYSNFLLFTVIAN